MRGSNPGQARDLAKTAGFLAKTDQVDARMLQALGRPLQPRLESPADPARERLAALHRRRDQLLRMRQQERTRLTEAERQELDAVAEELSEGDEAAVEREKGWHSKFEEAVGSADRLDKVAGDVVTHFERRREALGGGNDMIFTVKHSNRNLRSLNLTA